MALNTINTDAISFKKLSGKAHTQQNFALTEESIQTNIQVSYSTVFANPIEPLPATNSGMTDPYDTNGIVQKIRFELDLIPDTQILAGRSQGYRLKLPVGFNANGALYPEFVAGQYLYTALGKLQIVPSLYGTVKLDGSTEYDPILYTTTSVVIPKFDPINWYLDPYNGILFVQDPPAGFDVSSSRPGFLDAFLYVGDYVSDLLGAMISGSTGTTASNVGAGAGVFKTKVGQDLRFRSISGLNGIHVTGNTDNIIISYTGSTASTTTASQGLTKVGDDIRLGGVFTGLTYISGDTDNSSFILDTTNGGIFLREYGYGGINLHDVGIGGIYLQSTNVSGSGINFNSNSGIVATDQSDGSFSLQKNNDNGPFRFSRGGTFTNTIDILSGGTRFSSSNGMPAFYNADYSSNYSARSIPDVAWVLSQVTGNTGSTNVTANNGLTKSGDNIRLGGTLTGSTLIYGTGATLQFTMESPIATNTDIIQSENDITFRSLQNELATNNRLTVATGSTSAAFTGVDEAAQFYIGKSTANPFLGGDMGAFIGSVSGNSLIHSISLGNTTGVTIAAGVPAIGDYTNINLNNTGRIEVKSNVTNFKGFVYNDDYSAGFTNRSLPDVEWVLSQISGNTGSSAQNIYGARVVITASTTLNGSNFVVFSNGATGITLPMTPDDGQVYKIKDVSFNALNNPITIHGNGKNIDETPLIYINTNGGGVELCYEAALNRWLIMNFVG